MHILGLLSGVSSTGRTFVSNFVKENLENLMWKMFLKTVELTLVLESQQGNVKMQMMQ